MLSVGPRFSRSFLTRTVLYNQIQLQRKILDKYERAKVDRKKQEAFIESNHELF